MFYGLKTFGEKVNCLIWFEIVIIAQLAIIANILFENICAIMAPIQ